MEIEDNNILDFRIKVGKKLKDIRRKNDLTQEEMANILKMDTSYYGKIERGKNSLTLERVNLLCNKFDIDLNYLVLDNVENTGAIDEVLKRCPEEHREDVRSILRHLFKMANSIY